MSTTDTPKTDAAERWAEELVQRMFAGRKGHGGSDGVVYIQLRPDVLWEIAHESFEYGRHSQNRELAEALKEAKEALAHRNHVYRETDAEYDDCIRAARIADEAIEKADAALTKAAL